MTLKEKKDKLYSFLDLLRTDNVGAIVQMPMDGFTFGQVMTLVALYNRANRAQYALNKDIARFINRIDADEAMTDYKESDYFMFDTSVGMAE